MIVEQFVFKRLIEELRTFGTPNYPEFCIDAAKIFKEQEKKFKGIINQDRVSAVCLNSDLNELRGVLMDQSDIQFLGNAVKAADQTFPDQITTLADPRVIRPQTGALLEDSQIQK